MKKLSTIVLVYNEEKNVPLMLKALQDVATLLPEYDFEFLFVNDDNTASTLLFNVPSGIESGKYRLIVRTAYSAGSRVNKTVRNGVFAEIVSVE